MIKVNRLKVIMKNPKDIFLGKVYKIENDIDDF